MMRVSTCLRQLFLFAVLGAAARGAYAADTALEAYAKAVAEAAFREAGVSNRTDIVPACFRSAACCIGYDKPLQPSGDLTVALWSVSARCEELKRRPMEQWRLRVAYVPGPLGALEILQSIAVSKGGRFDPIACRTEEAAREALFKGSVDGILLATRRAPADLDLLADLGLYPYYFAIPAGTPEFTAVDQAMTRLKIYGRDRLDELTHRFYRTQPSWNRVRMALPLRSGLVEVNEHGQLQGAVVEFALRLAQSRGWAIDAIRCRSYREAKECVKCGAVDVLGGVLLTEDPRLCFPHAFLGYVRNYLVVRPDSPLGRGESEGWQNARIAVMEGTASAVQLGTVLTEYGAGATIVEFPSEREAVQAFEDGRCNLVLTTNAHEDPDRKVVYAMTPIPYYFCTSVPRQDLRAALDEAIARMFREESFVSLKIDRKYFSLPAGFACPTTIAEKNLIEEMRESGESVGLAIRGITTLPPGVSGLGAINELFERLLAERIRQRIGLSVHFTHEQCSPSDPLSYAWVLEHMWMSSGGPVSGQREEIRVNFNDARNPTLVALVRKALASFSDDEMLNLIYMAVTEGQDRPFLTRSQLIDIIAGVLVLALLYTLYAYRRIRAALIQAEGAAKAKTRFLATISHEIRTPLNAIVGFSEHLGTVGNDPAAAKDCVKGIRKSSDALLSLINDVLDLTKLDSGQVDLREGTCDLGRILSESTLVFGERARLKGLAMETIVPDRLPDFALFGPAVRQVLTNIVGNAFKYTDRGHVRFELDLIDAPDGCKTLLFRVSDTGCGISEEGLQNVFNPFVRDIAGHGGRVYEGTGLGLPIVKRLVDAMRGTVRLTSRLGVGTTVTVCIPAVEILSEARPWRVERETPVAGADASFAKLRVAVVDDVPMNLKIMKLHLQRAGVTSVMTFEDPVTALAELKVWPADLLLTDMWMPVVNGELLARQCRESGRLRGMRIVAVSADTDSGATFNLSIFDAVLPKPVTFDGVKACLAETLAQKEAGE